MSSSSMFDFGLTGDVDFEWHLMSHIKRTAGGVPRSIRNISLPTPGPRMPSVPGSWSNVEVGGDEDFGVHNSTSFMLKGTRTCALNMAGI
eukprot:TRINITY_DN26566_c0_g1_i1.p1 TRINITY_DN26566_c0_g1~~TRINITY_DN26566_c0_g1_i1.p1  ORF type:complete len:102 (+),score=18.58 TRINITY_DN26566_c0_g1_i1:37-306(+)